MFSKVRGVLHPAKISNIPIDDIEVFISLFSWHLVVFALRAVSNTKIA